MKPNAPREPLSAADETIAVIMPKEKAAGIRAFGAMKPGEIYRVAPAEALRLVTVKRFEYATDEDRRKAIAFDAARMAPATTTDAAPAVVANPED